MFLMKLWNVKNKKISYIKKYKIMKFRIFIILFFISFIAKSQQYSQKRGIPFIKNFTSNQYQAHEQNFDVVQDSSGIMYFANFEAVLIYDGAEWQKIPTKTGMRVLSLEVGKNNNIFVGGLYDFGVLNRNSNGTFQYKTLADSSYSTEYIDEIFDIEIIDNKVYFLSHKRMFIYNNNKIKVVDFRKTAKNALQINNELYIFFERNLTNDKNVQNGLTKYKNGHFLKIKDNTTAQILDVTRVFYLSENKQYVLGTESQGFFELKNNEIIDLDVPVNKYVKKNSMTCGTQINNNLFAIGTLTQGLILVNKNGEILQVINKKSSLIDESVNAIYLDASKNLWVATNNGISLIEINNALSGFFHKNTEINGKINKIINFNEKLFFATNHGLFVLNNSKIKKVQNFDIACMDAIVFNNKLFIASPQGVFLYDNQKIRQTSVKDFCFSVININNTFFVGQNSKIIVLNYNNRVLNLTDTIKGFSGNVIKMVQQNNKTVFAEIPPGKIYKIDLNSLKTKQLSSGKEFISLHLNKIGQRVFFSSEKGLFCEQAGKDTVQNFNLITNNKETSQLWLYDLFHIKDSLYIFNDGSRKNAAFLYLNNRDYKISKNSLLPISDLSIRTFYYDSKYDKLWLGGNNGVIIYDFQKKYQYLNKFDVLFTQIKILKNDSLLNIDTNYYKLKYSESSLLFKFSAPYYPAREKVYFRYFLDGFDNDTSDWTELNYKEYTNLPAGNYKFFVQAKDQFGNIIESDYYELKVLVPIARRWWMIVLYVIAVGILIKLFIDWRMRQAEKEKQHLEQIIKERTSEIEKSKAEIEAQRDVEYAQRKQIMSSIHYAKRIQQAVLPTQETVSEILGHNYFVLFRPYEVVSGDFFWLKQLKNFIAIVAADCTGHGVPGAFMSMLGTSFLNEIVTRRSLDNAAEVLERLRHKVKVSLHQKGKENEQKDGMDIAMYFIDQETLELQYAGAYNSLYVVRHKSQISEDLIERAKNEKKVKLFKDEKSDPNYILIELKADRQPIGIYIRERKFQNIKFKLKKNDCLYTFSDGYQDQFGGETGEKFNSKRFKRLFLSIQDKDMKEQHRILEQNFIKWKGDLDQVDDVIVFGVKIDFSV